ncbi:hypothetical protein [Candidatus Uabimicrobium sp. HlEnr_7]|uniref:hypothetical protein n=1 Tax=Candidatus Uabimicrobium helgolandensis TaxID=3095367 RepID=UPI003558DFA5
MSLDEIKKKLQILETNLEKESIAFFEKFVTPHGELQVFITARLMKSCKKGKIWKSREMLSTLKNAQYGFDIKASRSRGGNDGIFRIDRTFSPVNSMMKKIFKFIDKRDGLMTEITNKFNIPKSDWIAVRLVSHNLRLLGIIAITKQDTSLVIVDYDNDKGN